MSSLQFVGPKIVALKRNYCKARVIADYVGTEITPEAISVDV
jgi:hypothetical protein